MSKILEQFILSSTTPFLGTTDNQFGFKIGHGTDQCTFLLKQTVSYFVTYSSSVHAVFFSCLESIRSSNTHEIIWEINWKKSVNAFFAVTKTLVQGTNDANDWGKHLYEPFHVTNGFRQEGVLSPFLFAVYLDDLSTELNNIKARCYIGEVLLNHLMFADDIYVFCPSVRGLQSILDVCQAYAKSHEIIFNCPKTVCMTFKAKSAESTVTPLLTLGGQNVKSVNHCKNLGMALDTELSDDKDIQRQLRYQYCAANKLRVFSSRYSNAVRIYLFVPFVRPRMHHNYGEFQRLMHAWIANGLQFWVQNCMKPALESEC